MVVGGASQTTPHDLDVVIHDDGGRFAPPAVHPNHEKRALRIAGFHESKIAHAKLSVYWHIGIFVSE
jgi:hypothetical protein